MRRSGRTPGLWIEYRLEMAENTVLERQRLLRDLVTGRVNFKEALERGEQVGMDLSASFYQLMLFKLMPMGSAVAYSDRVVSCQEAIEERMEGRQHILVFDRGDEGWAFVLTGESEQEVERRMSECAASLGKMAGACKDIQYFGGIGSCVNRLGDLADLLSAGGEGVCRQILHGDEPDYKLQPDGRHGPRNRGNH